MGIRIADALAMRRDPGKLRFFSIADSLALKVYRITDLLPTEERYGLQSQLRRAALRSSPISSKARAGGPTRLFPGAGVEDRRRRDSRTPKAESRSLIADRR
jgi:hypothetical protein